MLDSPLRNTEARYRRRSVQRSGVERTSAPPPLPGVYDAAARLASARHGGTLASDAGRGVGQGRAGRAARAQVHARAAARVAGRVDVRAEHGRASAAWLVAV